MTYRYAPYGTWSSKLNANTAAGSYVSYSELSQDSGNLYFLELRPTEQGRTTLMCRTADGKVQELTPTPFSVRTMVHEYGGDAYTVHQGKVFFVNKVDQDIYVLDTQSRSPIKRLTNTGVSVRYANLVIDPVHQRIVCVRETHTDNVINDLVSLDCKDGRDFILHSGHDFYASPHLSPCASKIAFLAWDLPNMPWDGCLLYAGNLSQEKQVSSTQIIAGSRDESIVQPHWISKDALLFVSDRSGYWNIYHWSLGNTEILIEEQAEYGFPLWVFDLRSFVLLNNHSLVAIRKDQFGYGVDLVHCNLATNIWKRLGLSRYVSISSLIAYEQGVAFIGGTSYDLPAIVAIANIDELQDKILCSPGELTLPEDSISSGIPITYRNALDQDVHANLYLPCNDKFIGPSSDKPPLLVMSHGGPTAQASLSFSFKIQYFTSRGWAVLDVNYGGSTGYGREYRNRLKGNWGIVDVEDCVAGVNHLVSTGRVDPNRVAIRGGSAGGYTTLRALTTTDVFKVGASYYGIGDMRALVSDTHKFESEYLTNLIPAEAMDERSPINFVDNLNTPVIFYQGAEDAVVPPNQSELMFDALARKGIPTAMFLFDGEGHGFRKAESNKIALESELTFYSKVLGIKLLEVNLNCFDDARLKNATW